MFYSKDERRERERNGDKGEGVTSRLARGAGEDMDKRVLCGLDGPVGFSWDGSEYHVTCGVGARSDGMTGWFGIRRSSTMAAGYGDVGGNFVDNGKNG